MGWEDRSGHSYYYRKERRGPRVVSRYVGAGQTARFLAMLDALDREAEEEKRAAEIEAREATELGEAHAIAFGAVCETLTLATLLAEGFHTHKREWRRARCRK
jgi:thioesterase domain-containing protein